MKLVQKGSALVISLILLMVLTMLAIQSMRTNVMQERMAGNFRDRNTALQSAESALREAERRISIGAMRAGANIDPLVWDGTTFPSAFAGDTLLGFDPTLAQQPTFYVRERIDLFDEIDGSLRACWYVVNAAGFGNNPDGETNIVIEAVSFAAELCN